MPNLPLEGIRVLDFSTLLPGPFASLYLQEAGAEVIKVERPGEGDAMRMWPGDFEVLNKGKASIALDLKDPDAIQRLTPLIQKADVLIEQFRPGTMDRLGLGYEQVRQIRKDIIYCSINGYGSEGPFAQLPGHDMTYAANAGVLGLTTGAAGDPVVPWAMLSDIAGGSYPAVINILLALRNRDRNGEGAHIEIPLFDGLLAIMPWIFGARVAEGRWPRANDNPNIGSSPRYRLYRTSDGRYLAVCNPEEKFWRNFCNLIQLPADMAGSSDTGVVTEAVAERIAARSAHEWEQIFYGQDLCCAIVKTLEEAANSPLLRSRNLLQEGPNGSSPAMPLALSPDFRRCAVAPAPGLGANNRLLDHYSQYSSMEKR